jgi:hypothetical protein
MPGEMREPSPIRRATADGVAAIGQVRANPMKRGLGRRSRMAETAQPAFAREGCAGPGGSLDTRSVGV